MNRQIGDLNDGKSLMQWVCERADPLPPVLHRCLPSRCCRPLQNGTFVYVCQKHSRGVTRITTKRAQEGWRASPRRRGDATEHHHCWRVCLSWSSWSWTPCMKLERSRLIQHLDTEKIAFDTRQPCTPRNYPRRKNLVPWGYIQPCCSNCKRSQPPRRTRRSRAQARSITE